MSRLSSMLRASENDKNDNTKDFPGLKPRKAVPVAVYTAKGQQVKIITVIPHFPHRYLAKIATTTSECLHLFKSFDIYCTHTKQNGNRLYTNPEHNPAFLIADHAGVCSRLCPLAGRSRLTCLYGHAPTRSVLCKTCYWHFLKKVFF